MSIVKGSLSSSGKNENLPQPKVFSAVILQAIGRTPGHLTLDLSATYRITQFRQLSTRGHHCSETDSSHTIAIVVAEPSN
jgi:hypothetical protein